MVEYLIGGDHGTSPRLVRTPAESVRGFPLREGLMTGAAATKVLRTIGSAIKTFYCQGVIP